VPYRDRAQVEKWISEFWDTHSLFDKRISILDDEFVSQPNSGMVVVGLERSPGLTYLSVKMVDEKPRWTVMFEARPEPVHLDADGVRALANEIGALGVLCEYLQQRTDDAIQAAATH
jgi:hypothetical protein